MLVGDHRVRKRYRCGLRCWYPVLYVVPYLLPIEEDQQESSLVSLACGHTPRQSSAQVRLRSRLWMQFSGRRCADPGVPRFSCMVSKYIHTDRSPFRPSYSNHETSHLQRTSNEVTSIQASSRPILCSVLPSYRRALKTSVRRCII